MVDLKLRESIMLEEDVIEVAMDKLKKSADFGSNLEESEIIYNDIEYIYEETVEGVSVNALEFPASSKEKKLDYLDCPPSDPLSGEETIVRHSVVTNYEEESLDEECILPHSPPLFEHSESGSSPALTKNRKTNTALWKSNIRKRLRESGQQYETIRKKKLVPAKKLKAPCNDDCIYQCANVFTNEDRLNIFQSFWNLTDHEKNSFYLKFVVRNPVKRRRVKSSSNIKQFSFNYFFEKNESMLRVCRTFFMNTLCVNNRRIYYCFGKFQNKDSSCLPRKKEKNPKRVKAPNGLSESDFSAKPSLAKRKKMEIADTLKPPCSNCGFTCVNVFTNEDRLNIFQSFRNMTEHEKNKFYLKFVVRKSSQRQKTRVSEASVKQYSFNYFFEKKESLHRVCRTFFMNTLCIDEKRIYCCFVNLKNKVAGSSLTRKNGENTKPSPALRKISSKTPELWKCNRRESYKPNKSKSKSMRKEMAPAKGLKPPCSDCIFKCLNVFTDEDRLNIFQSFWNMTDNEKNNFYFKYVVRNPVQRRRVKSDASVKQYSFNYFFEKNESLHRVCRTFFVNTLSIHQKRIYYCFANVKNNVSNSLPRKNAKRVKTLPNRLAEVREHISSIATVEVFHDCQANSDKKYVEASLNLNRMYKLYLQNYEDPVAINVYRKVFNKDFDISFHKTKKDECDICRMFESKENIKTPAEQEMFEQHQAEKAALKADRDCDRINTDPTKCIVCYDLQSVFNLPKGNASLYYYKRKLNMFNLTATVIMPNVNKFTYCALWTEIHSDRSGNDIASALIKILKELINEYPRLRSLILWSDSGVPPNKITATAIKMFLKISNIDVIIQKISEPGHSLLPEVACVHEVIDKHLKKFEIHSPLHLIKLLENVPSKKTPLIILHMLATDFHIYSKVANKIDFRKVPFSKIKLMIYEKSDEFKIQFKNSVRDKKCEKFYIIKLPSTKCLRTALNIFEQKLNILKPSSISEEKKNDINDLLTFLPHSDRKYFEDLLNI